ncbi:spore coat protein U domain-containing protein [Sphingomonas sp. TREG-RG-20F-R18-01]|uniref:Csu type fimbrial protein n=1 Tax=Sphingomonas sp. TREG-RG-20F-R18-01 TaxID=2914982 RepID=UPI001F598DCB|nr:spore coat protein U domain-containing protein [Sphingomonas sp. TREG-RG-20F-R18-01]
MTIKTFRASSTIAATFGLVVLFAQPVTAQTATTTSTMAASATVTANCTVNTTALAFGGADVTDGQPHDGAGSLKVLCTNGTAWTAAADKGQGTAATIALRQMTFGTDKLNYILYTTAAKAAIWGDGTEGSTIANTGTGAEVTFPVAGTISAGQTGMHAGVYGDIVTVTVTY